MRYIILINLLFMLSCDTSKDNKRFNTNIDPILIGNSDTITERKMNSDDSLGLNYSKFAFENDSIMQEIIISKVFKNELHFKILSKNKKRNIISKINGIAYSNSKSDPEIDEDEEGNAYPAEQFNFNESGCFISIRIDMQLHDKLKIVSECPDYDKINCPFTSLGLLRRE